MAFCFALGYGLAMLTSQTPPPPPSDSDTETTHFGFRTVATQEKQSLVRGVFDAVADNYDLMNDLMSGGIHRLWKDRFVEWLAPRPGQAFIDVAGGTGDIAFRILAEAKRRSKPESALTNVTVCDINTEMLRVGRDRAVDRGLLQGLTWVEGNAEELPFADASFDAFTIAFGLRNVTHIDAALAEARRVLKPGGRFLCLEFSKVEGKFLETLYNLYSFKILPEIGARVAGNREAYQYLAESIRRFPPQQALLDKMAAVGLGRGSYRNLSGGIAAMHSAWRV